MLLFLLISIVFVIFHTGIPSDVDLNQIEDHWRKCHQAKPDALTILTKLFRDMNEVIYSIIKYAI